MKEKVKQFFQRMVMGLLLILALNIGFDLVGIPLKVGVNPITAASCGFLGVPGVIMLYGIAGCKT